MDKAQEEAAAREILKVVSEISFDQTSGHIDREVQRIIRDMTGIEDPFANSKSYYTDLAIRAYPELKQTVNDSEDAFTTAVRVALAGSAIDYVFNGRADIVTIFNGVERVISRPPVCDHTRELADAVQRASSILYIADNAGETVFDRILIEELPREKVAYVVRGAPIINDATARDAEFAGITDLVEVIDNGSDAPGTILDQCSKEFRERFEAADLVISKGQANFKTLSRSEREIFFLFRVKCTVLSQLLNCNKNELMVMDSKRSFNGRKLHDQKTAKKAS